MNWLIWRQHRKQWLFFGLFLALFTAVLIPTGQHYWDAYQDAIASCGATSTCNTLRDTLFQSGQTSLRTIGQAVTVVGLVVPFLLGVFLGAPLLAKEYEDGTNKLVWAQSASRGKWLTLKLLWALAFAAAYGAAMTLLVTWWSRTGNALYQFRFTPSEFDVQGYMPVVYALFATALGVMIGAWLRRVMLALVVTLMALVAIQVGIAYGVRPHYAQPVTVNNPLGADAVSSDNSWVLYRSIIDNHGKAIDGITPNTEPEECKSLQRDKSMACLNSLGYHGTMIYQPADRYWKFQLIEALLYVGLSGAAIAGTYFLVLRRDA